MYDDRCANDGISPEPLDIGIAQSDASRCAVGKKAAAFDAAAVNADLTAKGCVPRRAQAVCVRMANILYCHFVIYYSIYKY